MVVFPFIGMPLDLMSHGFIEAGLEIAGKRLGDKLGNQRWRLG